MNDWHWGLWGALEKFELVSTQQVSTGLRLDALRSGAVVLISEGSSGILRYPQSWQIEYSHGIRPLPFVWE